MSRTPSLPPPSRTTNAEPSLRAQILATEHWSLLATRSTTQNEVLSRISTFLTLVSANLVSLALIGQVTRFDRRFVGIALVLIAFVAVVGALTQVRIENASNEDLAHVIGMNRLRAGYTDIDPGAERYFVTSNQDDEAGVSRTYNHLRGATTVRQVLGSSFTFIVFVNSGLAAVFGALCAVALGAPGWLLGVVAAVVGVAYFMWSYLLALRRYRRMRAAYQPMFPTVSPPAPPDLEPTDGTTPL
jgi:Ca2+/Na+ antiporter